jgi:RNA polymerase sigma factor (TIGR02999 family)
MGNQHALEYEDRVRDLLAAIRQGDRPAFDALIEAVGHEMRKLSAYHLRQNLPAVVQTLQTTALVHEAVLRMIQALNRDSRKFPETKAHFMALVSQMMRYTLIDYARKRKMKLVSLDEPRRLDDGETGGAAPADALRDWSDGDLDSLLAVDEALTSIDRADPEYGKRRSAAIELHLFGGMNYREIADELGITDDTARRDCQIALSRLRGILTEAPNPSSLRRRPAP